MAGILRERMLFNMSEEEWDPVLATHLKGTFTVFRAASAVMRKQEGGGTLIGFTSGNHQGSVSQANYSAAKGGIISLVRSAALGLHRYGVTANAVAPVARTRMSAGVPMELAEIGEPEDVAALVVYLLSERARAERITGQVYTIMRPQDRGLGPAEGAEGGVRGGGGLDPGTDRGLPAGDGGGRPDADAGEGGGDGGSGPGGGPPEPTLKPVRRLRTGGPNKPNPCGDWGPDKSSPSGD